MRTSFPCNHPINMKKNYHSKIHSPNSHIEGKRGEDKNNNKVNKETNKE